VILRLVFEFQLLFLRIWIINIKFWVRLPNLKSRRTDECALLKSLLHLESCFFLVSRYLLYGSEFGVPDIWELFGKVSASKWFYVGFRWSSVAFYGMIVNSWTDILCWFWPNPKILVWILLSQWIHGQYPATPMSFQN
jgi:hypothetical protein